jgi:transposase, IS6 family
MPNRFKGRHFPADFILLCVRWYLKFNISYRHLAEMMQKRSFDVHHTTIYRWIQTYAPQLEKLIRWYQGHTGCSWRVDETYIKVFGEWLYLFRAIDSRGRTIDFYLSQRRDAGAARRFLAKACACVPTQCFPPGYLWKHWLGHSKTYLATRNMKVAYRL